jgi:hypothetical protein
LSFFEPLPPPPDPLPRVPQPPWRAPPENELGTSVPLRLLIAKNDEFAIAIVEVVAYLSGFRFELVHLVSPTAEDLDHKVTMRLSGSGLDTPSEQFRFGVEFSDGRKATNTLPWAQFDDEPDITLIPRGGGGGGRSWRQSYWVYPLPPPGALIVAVARPSRGIPEQTHTLDAEPIIEAAASSIVLWDDRRSLDSHQAS